MNSLLAQRLREHVRTASPVPRGLARPAKQTGAELPLLDRLHAAFAGMKKDK